MPAPSVRQDVLFTHRDAKEKVREEERQAAGAELRQCALAKLKEEKAKQPQQQEEELREWRRRQHTRKAVEKTERAQSARGRSRAIADLEKGRLAARKEADARESSGVEEAKKLM